MSVISWVSAVEGCPLSRVPLYMAANIHTTSANAVTLVWGSLRLAPIKSYYVFGTTVCGLYYREVVMVYK